MLAACFLDVCLARCDLESQDLHISVVQLRLGAFAMEQVAGVSQLRLDFAMERDRGFSRYQVR